MRSLQEEHQKRMQKMCLWTTRPLFWRVAWYYLGFCFCVATFLCLFDSLWCNLSFLNLTLCIRTLINCTARHVYWLLPYFRFHDYKLKLRWCFLPSVHDHVALAKEIMTYNQKTFRIFSKEQKLRQILIIVNQFTEAKNPPNQKCIIFVIIGLKWKKS